MKRFVLIISFLNAAACTNLGELIVFKVDTGQVLYANPALQAQALKILQTSCESCHGVNSTNGVTNITNVYFLVENQLVVPGEPTQGRVILSIENGTMPKDGPTLSAKQLSTVKAWVESMSWVTPQ